MAGSGPVEEDFEFKNCLGLGRSQVRPYYAIARHTMLAALAICAVTAALLKGRTGSQAPPSGPGQPPPADPGRSR